MRLIDADELKKEMQDRYNGEMQEACFSPNDFIIDWLNEAPTVDLWHYPSKGEYPPDNFSYVLVAKDNEVFYGAYVDFMEQWVIYPLNGMQTRYYVAKVDAWMSLLEVPKESV